MTFRVTCTQLTAVCVNCLCEAMANRLPLFVFISRKRLWFTGIIYTTWWLYLCSISVHSDEDWVGHQFAGLLASVFTESTVSGNKFWWSHLPADWRPEQGQCSQADRSPRWPTAVLWYLCWENLHNGYVLFGQWTAIHSSPLNLVIMIIRRKMLIYNLPHW